MKSLKFYRKDLNEVFHRNPCTVWKGALVATFNGLEYFYVNRDTLRFLDKVLRRNIKYAPQYGGYSKIDYEKPYKLLLSYIIMAGVPLCEDQEGKNLESFTLSCAKKLVAKLRKKD